MLTIPAKNLKSFWEIVLNQPHHNAKASIAAHLSSVFSPVVINVVNGKKFSSGFSAAITFITAISFINYVPFRLSVIRNFLSAPFTQPNSDSLSAFAPPAKTSTISPDKISFAILGVLLETFPAMIFSNTFSFTATRAQPLRLKSGSSGALSRHVFISAWFAPIPSHERSFPTGRTHSSINSLLDIFIHRGLFIIMSIYKAIRK